MTLLQMSIQGGLLIILIVIIRSVWLNSLPKTVFIVMWESAILRLLLPIKLPFDISVPEKLTQIVPAAQFKESDAIVSQGSELIPNILPMEQAQTAEGTITVSTQAIVWFIGAVAFALYFAITYIRCRREFRTAMPIKSEFIANWLDGQKLRRTVTVRQSAAISSPLTYGIINPVILLPKNIDTNNKQQLKIILMHEFTHIRKFDGVLKLFSTAAVCIHWFNPLVWIMRELVSRDIELRCDESVLKELGIDSRADYALALIELEEKRSGLQPIGSGFAKSAVEERITAIMKYKNPTILSVVFAVILIIAVAVTAVVTVFAVGNNTADNNMLYIDGVTIIDPAEGYKELYIESIGSSYFSHDILLPLSEARKVAIHSLNESIIITNEGSAFTYKKGAVVTISVSINTSPDYADSENGEIVGIGFIYNNLRYTLYSNFVNTEKSVQFLVPEDGDYMFFVQNNDSVLMLNIEEVNISVTGEAASNLPFDIYGRYVWTSEDGEILPVNDGFASILFGEDWSCHYWPHYVGAHEMSGIYSVDGDIISIDFGSGEHIEFRIVDYTTIEFVSENSSEIIINNDGDMLTDGMRCIWINDPTIAHP